ncbi:LexA family transcriptional regulator [Legionella hackeliae]|uniref:Peptidase S24-like domain protein n=2 Tax=Legionella hackeliae TaxID=449 RepID=A0A0A8UQA1_LEGHA|nr:LexA family transcriptional regulator [Legionella hackeliae]KTD12951.1 HTH-type transcriptional regulator [Legionella hackeliae]CEK09262.1 Peptidase S24-like domain protein [Legionella hackeliae]STX49169.1 HTH-type transcriptional regulator [Legionella hackeliae]
MNYIGINLKKLLQEENISENEFSKRIGIPQQMINRIISGENQNPKLSTITPIANYFKIPLQELISNANCDSTSSRITLTPNKIPYITLEEIKEHGIGNAILHAKKFITIDLDKSKNYFATTMNDNSMEPKFSKGTILVFDKEKEPNNGDFCLLKCEDKHYVFRQIMINSTNKKFIKCLNPTSHEYNIIPLPINIYVLATLLESRTLF